LFFRRAYNCAEIGTDELRKLKHGDPRVASGKLPIQH
jgi:hypothetical protein